MSGQPNKNPTDADKYRQQYLSNLDLRAKLNDIDLQANKIFQKTQQTPTQLTDMRTPSEKYADIEGLKRDIRSELSAVTDGVSANAIVEQLNINEILLLSTQIKQILENVKLKYKYGILPDIFIAYFRRYMANEVRTMGVNDGLQQSTGRDILLGVQQILRQMITPADLNTLEGRIRGMRDADAGLQRRIIDEIQILQRIMPTAEGMARINQITNADLRAQIQTDLNLALQNIPTKPELDRALSQLDTAQRLGDAQRVRQVVGQIQQMRAVEPSTYDAIRSAERSILEAVGRSRIENPGVRNGVAYMNLATIGKATRPQLISYLEFIYVNIPGLFLGKTKGEINGANKDEAVDLLKQYDPQIRDFFGLGGTRPQYVKAGLTEAQLALIRPEDIATGRVAFKPAGGSSASESTGPPESTMRRGASEGSTSVRRQSDTTPLGPQIGKTSPAGQNVGTKGRGIRKMKGRGIMLEHTDFSTGLTPSNRYVPFGKYFIHNHKLNDDIISLRHSSGSNIIGLPSVRVSRPLAKVVKTIVGNGNPTYDELDKLNDDDRRYLHTIAKKSNLLDKISVPTPSKDLEKEEINKFEIMRGEIMSGNDNRDFIKEFKLLLVKLTNKGLLPSRQSKELLMDLASLGY